MIYIPSYARLSGKCFKGCVQGVKLFTIYSGPHSLEHLPLYLSCDGTDFPVDHFSHLIFPTSANMDHVSELLTKKNPVCIALSIAGRAGIYWL